MSPRRQPRCGRHVTTSGRTVTPTSISAPHTARPHHALGKPHAATMPRPTTNTSLCPAATNTFAPPIPGRSPPLCAGVRAAPTSPCNRGIWVAHERYASPPFLLVTTPAHMKNRTPSAGAPFPVHRPLRVPPSALPPLYPGLGAGVCMHERQGGTCKECMRESVDVRAWPPSALPITGGGGGEGACRGGGREGAHKGWRVRGWGVRGGQKGEYAKVPRPQHL